MTQNYTECIAAECTIMYQNAAAGFCGTYVDLCQEPVQNLEPGDSRRLSLWPQNAPTNLVSAGVLVEWTAHEHLFHSNLDITQHTTTDYTSGLQCSSSSIRRCFSETAYICSKMGVVQSSVGIYIWFFALWLRTPGLHIKVSRRSSPHYRWRVLEDLSYQHKSRRNSPIMRAKTKRQPPAGSIAIQ